MAPPGGPGHVGASARHTGPRPAGRSCGAHINYGMYELRYVWEHTAADGGDRRAQSTCIYIGRLEKETYETSPPCYDGQYNQFPFTAGR